MSFPTIGPETGPTTPSQDQTLQPQSQPISLKTGQRLSREEFERRYKATPKGFKAELIEGVVCVASPAKYQHHGRPNRWVSGWLFAYESMTPGVEGGDNTTTRQHVWMRATKYNLTLF